MHAPGQSPDIPFISPSVLAEYDGFLLGIPTRYGNFPAQWKTFWDSTGQQWQTGAYWGKYAGVFISTGTLGGGQESTAIASMSTLTHHGIIYVPLGYKTVFPSLANLSEVHGGSPWGAGTFSVSELQNPLSDAILSSSFFFFFFLRRSTPEGSFLALTCDPRALMDLANRLRLSSTLPGLRARLSMKPLPRPYD